MMTHTTIQQTPGERSPISQDAPILSSCGVFVGLKSVQSSRASCQTRRPTSAAPPGPSRPPRRRSIGSRRPDIRRPAPLRPACRCRPQPTTIKIADCTTPPTIDALVALGVDLVDAQRFVRNLAVLAHRANAAVLLARAPQMHAGHHRRNRLVCNNKR